MRRIASVPHDGGSLNLKCFFGLCAAFCTCLAASSLMSFIAETTNAWGAITLAPPQTGQAVSKSDYLKSVVDQSPPRQMMPTTPTHELTSSGQSKQSLQPVSMEALPSPQAGTILSEQETPWVHSYNCGFNFSSIAPHRLPDGWCLDDEKVPRYFGVGDEQNGMEWNVVKHYNHDGYERCLADKTIVFVGDSRVRYQFMHLANFLLSKKRMECEDLIEIQKNTGLSLPDDSCFLVDHKHHQKMDLLAWNEWYSQSAVMLAKQGEQMSLCDCFRDVPFTTEGTYENRFIQRQTPRGTVNLVYLQSFRNWVRIDREFPPFAPFVSKHPSARCVPGSCGDVNRTNAFSGNLNETLWTVLPLLNATHAFVSLGWLNDFQQDQKLSCAIKEFEVHHPHTKVEIITHVPGKGGFDRLYDAKKLDCPSVGVFNRWDMVQGVPKFWYWDNLHVLGILNEAFNHKLLEQICPLGSLF